MDHGPTGAECIQLDQRGRFRPGGHFCDIGAIESGAQRLRVCQDCDDDPANLTFGDLQAALDWAVAGDTVAIEAGVYTGNFVVYKDLTLEHAGVDTTLLNRDQPADVRAILQASDLSIREQSSRLDPQQVSGLSGSVLTTGSCKLTDTTIVPAGEVEVTLRGLTIQHGLARLGGGIVNLGTLHVVTSTIADNAAVNQLDSNGNVVIGRGGEGRRHLQRRHVDPGAQHRLGQPVRVPWRRALHPRPERERQVVRDDRGQHGGLQLGGQTAGAARGHRGQQPGIRPAQPAHGCGFG